MSAIGGKLASKPMLHQMNHPRFSKLLDASPSTSIIWGCGTPMHALDAMASKMAPANRSLLVMGEQKIEHGALNIATSCDLQTVLQELQLNWNTQPLSRETGPALSRKIVACAAFRQAKCQMIRLALDCARSNRQCATQELQISHIYPYLTIPSR